MAAPAVALAFQLDDAAGKRISRHRLERRDDSLPIFSGKPCELLSRRSCDDYGPGRAWLRRPRGSRVAVFPRRHSTLGETCVKGLTRPVLSSRVAALGLRVERRGRENGQDERRRAGILHPGRHRALRRSSHEANRRVAALENRRVRGCADGNFCGSSPPSVCDTIPQKFSTLSLAKGGCYAC
jgi:hypothetical protein